MCGVVPLVSRTVLRLRPSDSCAILGADPSDRGPLFEMGAEIRVLVSRRWACDTDLRSCVSLGSPRETNRSHQGGNRTPRFSKVIADHGAGV
jgi:hypothetical protein